MWLGLYEPGPCYPGSDRRPGGIAYASTMEFETLTVGADRSLGRIVLNRPATLNSMTPQLLEELIGAARWFEPQLDVRVVVISGAGRSFTSGFDLDSFAGMLSGGWVERRELSGLGGRMADAIEGMRAVTIAQLHGWVVGGGMVLASACDLRVAATDTRFKIPEVELGLPLNWAGIPRLVREIGPARTRELVMTCREFTAQEAVGMGFLNRVVPLGELEATVAELAVRLISMPAVPLLSTKASVNAVALALSARIGSTMDAEMFLGAALSPEFLEATQAYTRRVKGAKEQTVE